VRPSPPLAGVGALFWAVCEYSCPRLLYLYLMSCDFALSVLVLCVLVLLLRRCGLFGFEKSSGEVPLGGLRSQRSIVTLLQPYCSQAPEGMFRW
jgi:uncharacterized sodium:solute symporter family permease YidK